MKELKEGDTATVMVILEGDTATVKAGTEGIVYEVNKIPKGYEEFARRLGAQPICYLIKFPGELIFRVDPEQIKESL